MRYVLVAALVCVACSREPEKGRSQSDLPAGDLQFAGSPGRECVSGALAIQEDGIGVLRVGESVERVARACHVLRDTTSMGGEAIAERTLLVAVRSDTVEATVEQNRVWRISIGSSTFATNDSIRVGVPLGALLRQDGAIGIEGEGRLFVTLGTHCGLSFRLDYEPSAAEHRNQWQLEDLRRVPAKSRVDQILVVGCK